MTPTSRVKLPLAFLLRTLIAAKLMRWVRRLAHFIAPELRPRENEDGEARPADSAPAPGPRPLAGQGNPGQPQHAPPGGFSPVIRARCGSACCAACSPQLHGGP